MILKKGDMVYCHTDGFFDCKDHHKDGVQFATKNRYYKVVSVSGHEYEIRNDSDESHTFTKEHLLEGHCRWFSVRQFLSEKKYV